MSSIHFFPWPSNRAGGRSCISPGAPFVQDLASLPILSSQEVCASPPHTATDSLPSNLITAETGQGRETWTGVIAIQIDCISHPAFL